MGGGGAASARVYGSQAMTPAGPAPPAAAIDRQEVATIAWWRIRRAEPVRRLGGGAAKALTNTAAFLKEQGRVQEVKLDYSAFVTTTYVTKAMGK